MFDEAGIESEEAEEEQNTVEVKNYPPQKKIINYILRQTSYIQHNSRLEDLDKVQEMTILLEGFICYLNDTNKILKLDVEKILTYIYYPESEKITLDNKDNLMA